MIVVIPARRKSGRVPDKPLQMIGSRSVIQHTYDRVNVADCSDRVIIAVDDPEVEAHCDAFGAETFMTPDEGINNGTERVAYVVEQLGLPTSQPVLNVQGDKYDLNPGALDELADHVIACQAPSKHRTLFCMREPLSADEAVNSAVVKVLTDKTDNALIFTRSYVPGSAKHCGIYGYYTAFLAYYRVLMKSTRLEGLESLEQMRVLDNCGTVYCPPLRTVGTSGRAINVMADLEYARGQL